MKNRVVPTLLLLALALATGSQAVADTRYADMVFTAVSIRYWCTFGKVPQTVEDFAKVTDLEHQDPRITLDPAAWLKAVKFSVQNGKLRILKAVTVEEQDGTTTEISSYSVGDCKSFDPPIR